MSIGRPKESPSVEVIIPTYLTRSNNGVSWLNKAIESVFSQTYCNWHLTMVDDASPLHDLSLQNRWCHQYPEKCSLITLSTQGGAAAARMKAIQTSDAPIIALLDQDDLYETEKLEKQVKAFSSNSSIGAVHTDVAHIDQEGVVIENAADRENAFRSSIDFENLSHKAVASSIFERNSIRVISAAFLRHTFLESGGYNTTLNGGEDWELWVRFSNKFRIKHIALPLLKRRVHTSNTSKVNLIERLKGQLEAVDIMVEDMPFLSSLGDKKRQAIQQKIQSAANKMQEPQNIETSNKFAA